MDKHSRYQQKIIKNYYDNRHSISLQRLQELVTELYLAEGKKRERQWKLVARHLGHLGLKQERIDYLMGKNDPALIAQVVNQLMEQ